MFFFENKGFMSDLDAGARSAMDSAALGGVAGFGVNAFEVKSNEILNFTNI